MKILDKLKNKWIEMNTVKCHRCKSEDFKMVARSSGSEGGCSGGTFNRLKCNECDYMWEVQTS